MAMSRSEAWWCWWMVVGALGAAVATLYGCDPQSPPAPGWEPQGEWCQAACQNRAALEPDCPRRKAVPEDRCIQRCTDLEAKKPGITGAKCVAGATCATLKNCAPAGAE